MDFFRTSLVLNVVNGANPKSESVRKYFCPDKNPISRIRVPLALPGVLGIPMGNVMGNARVWVWV
jgi:hypothetical protein